MKTLIVGRIAVIFVLCVVAWYLVPWPVALLLTILSGGYELQALTLRRMMCFIATVQRVHRNTPGADNAGPTKAG